MKKRYVAPFTSDIPQLDPSRFAGRKTQIELIADALFQTKHGKPTNIIITGERGIGKSSLLNQSRELAQGDLTLLTRLGINTSDLAFDYIAIWHDAAKDQGPLEIVSGIMDGLVAFNIAINPDTEGEDAPNLLRTHSDNQKNLTQLVSRFCTAISRASQYASKHGKDGVLILLDELDRADPNSGVATFFKLVIEKLARDKIRNVAFMCAGMSGAIQHLEEDHASIYRNFRDVHVSRLAQDETRSILEAGFQAAGFEFDPSVFPLIHQLAAGYPEPVHLLGSQALALDTDNAITDEDVRHATRQIISSLRKSKYLALLHKAGTGKNQLILKTMAEYNHLDVPVDHISNALAQPHKQYHTNMVNLQTKGLIALKKKGIYAIVDPLFREYIRELGVLQLETEACKEA